ncbi:hypothetical protein JIN84_09840 [Luteolibacter yonseiensis]|uniref:Uncharacterized protein n=1 Tax=Luteolibacter yonseiensis TaxID=1144680 RepID=A0A934R629_9BACT|nr:hypothetical protein [Luteolibacter yonseiensis]MBK1815920.1 hypothetical protein [Luteolibacter yonseiensis]
MDDIPAILENEAIRTGAFWNTKTQLWTNMWYFLEARVFGFSPAGFHAVNWLLHTAVACVLFGLGRDLLRGKWPAGVAWFGALLFAVHPLASEIPNYARTQDLAWVTLFSLLAAWAMLRYLGEGGWELVRGEDGQIPVFQKTHRWRKLVWCALAVAGATFSKGPGFLHAVMAVAMVVLAFFPKGGKRAWPWIAGLAVLGLLVVWGAGIFGNALNGLARWQEPRFIGHGYTVARVFWEFAWRSVVPVALSADHHIAETLVPKGVGYWNVPDRVAIASAWGMLALGALGVVLACREKWRVLGVCLALFVGTIAFRVFYLIPEFMPEYRIYPGLPWFCLGAAVVLAAAWQWLFAHVSPRGAVVVLLGGLAVLSAQRSFLWHDLDLLMKDVLRQYPAQARAIWELQDRDLKAGRWQEVIARHERDFPEVRRRFIASLGALAPARELPTGHFTLAETACMGRYARAVAHVKGPAEGLRRMADVESYLRLQRINPKTNPAHWNHFGHDKALILEMAGDYAAALKAMEPRSGEPQGWPFDYERIRQKQEDVTP